MKVLLVGGGTGGHICPLAPLAQELEKQNSEVELVVSNGDLDLEITNQLFSKNKTYYLKTGKIRRYFSFQNFIDFFQRRIHLLPYFNCRKISPKKIQRKNLPPRIRHFHRLPNQTNRQIHHQSFFKFRQSPIQTFLLPCNYKKRNINKK